ncbi:MAG: GntR family transcriptional regulator [Rubrobacteraceae bacterium]
MTIRENSQGRTQGGNFKRPLTAQEAVLRELRRAIMARELKPGDRVGQGEVAERFGVSRVPVREALKVLEAEGQVAYRPHRGFTVTELSIAELEELYLMRRLLESEAVRRAIPNVDGELLGRLWELLEETERVCAAGDFLGVMEWDREFHLALFERSRLPRLIQSIRLLWQNAEPYRSVFLNDPASRRRARREHRAIVEACERGDAEGAVSALDIHRDNAITDLAEILDGEAGISDGERNQSG